MRTAELYWVIEMLTKNQFKSLRVGDVVLFNGRPRTVRDIKWTDTKCGGRGYVTFSILHRSWTGRICTTYDYNAIKNICSLPRKVRDRSDVCNAEELALLANGFDVLQGVEREIKQEEGLKKRGFNAHSQFPKALSLLKKARRKLKRR